MTGAMLYSIGGILRLVRFNVKATEAKGNADAVEAQKKHFTGLPITLSAIAAVSANLFFSSPFGQSLFPMEGSTLASVLTGLMIVLGYFMVSRWKFPSMKMLHFRVPSFQLVLFTVVIAIFVLYGILYFFPVVLALISWGYIALALCLSIIRLIAGRKSKTLEDFEPEPEDE